MSESTEETTYIRETHLALLEKCQKMGWPVGQIGTRKLQGVQWLGEGTVSGDE